MIPSILLFIMCWNAPEPSKIRIISEPVTVVSVSNSTEKQDNRNKILLWTSAALIGSSIADIERSQHLINAGRGYEANPLLRPFMKSRATAYGFVMGLNAFTIWMAHRNQKPWLPMLGVGMHGFAISWSFTQ